MLASSARNADQHGARSAISSAEQPVTVIRFAGEHRGAAGTTNTLFTPGPDVGQNLADPSHPEYWTAQEVPRSVYGRVTTRW